MQTDQQCIEYAEAILHAEGLYDWQIKLRYEDGIPEGVTLFDSKTIRLWWRRDKPSFALVLHEIAHAKVGEASHGEGQHGGNFASALTVLVRKYCQPILVT